jgi:predicted ABC-type ATPase
MHTIDGEFTPERLMEHSRILDERLSGKKSHNPPLAVLMAGGPAAGKSRLLEALLLPPDAVVIDPDALREELPEYTGFVANERADAAVLTHEEVRLIAHQMFAIAGQRRLNLVLDAVGSNDEGQFSRRIEPLIKHGYSVTVRYATVPLDVAIERAKARYEAGGRHVAEDVIREKHAAVSRGVFRVAELPVERIEIYSTVGPDPELIAEGRGGSGLGGLRVLDDARYAEFLEKGEQ